MGKRKRRQKQPKPDPLQLLACTKEQGEAYLEKAKSWVEVAPVIAKVEGTRPLVFPVAEYLANLDGRTLWDNLAREATVHTEHCCFKHGCKYGDDDCPVSLGTTPQSFPCEACGWAEESGKEIRDCPFCGSLKCDTMRSIEGWARVECKHCNAAGPQVTFDAAGAAGEVFEYRADIASREAIRGWNSFRLRTGR